MPNEESRNIVLPPIISAISNEDLRNLHAKVNGWLSYRRSQLIEIVVVLSSKHEDLDRKYAYIVSDIGSIEKWKTEIVARKDKNYSDLKQEVVMLEAQKTALELEIKKLEARSQVISREQAFRESLLRSGSLKEL